MREYRKSDLGRYKFDFPALGLNLVAIPKTGSSSVLNLAVFAEEMKRGFDKDSIFGPRQNQLQFPTMEIHDKLDKYRTRDPYGHVDLSIHRNVYSRSLSAFVDKLLLARDPVYFRIFHNLDLMPWGWSTVQDIQESYKAFLNVMQADISGIFSNDGHWAPQTAWVRTDHQSSAYHGLSESLDKLDSHLNSSGIATDEFEVGKMNESPSLLRQVAWNDKLIETVSQMYTGDIDFFSNAGLDKLNQRPDLANLSNLRDAEVELTLAELSLEANKRMHLFFKRDKEGEIENTNIHNQR